MAGEPQTLVIGNLTEDATLNYTASGRAVANLNIANNPRYFNKQTSQWEEGETWFVRGSIWGDYAANVVESLRKGMQVMAWGRLVNRSFEDRQGNQRSAVEMQIDEVGPTLRFATAQVVRVQGNQHPQPPQHAPQAAPSNAWGAAPTGDVWAGGGTPQGGPSPF